ncbi:MAG: hypothetical protein H7259_04295 [Cytophagales bacterium]|nr:hypothetical protein [Cytophaga sp.]
MIATTTIIPRNTNRAVSGSELFKLLYKSEWITCNGSYVIYQFTNMEINEKGNVEGILFMGEKLLDVELEPQHVVYKSFRIDKYIFLITSDETMTVFINNQDLEQIQLKRIYVD